MQKSAQNSFYDLCSVTGKTESIRQHARQQAVHCERLEKKYRYTSKTKARRYRLKSQSWRKIGGYDIGKLVIPVTALFRQTCENITGIFNQLHAKVVGMGKEAFERLSKAADCAATGSFHYYTNPIAISSADLVQEPMFSNADLQRDDFAKQVERIAKQVEEKIVRDGISLSQMSLDVGYQKTSEGSVSRVVSVDLFNRE